MGSLPPTCKRTWPLGAAAAAAPAPQKHLRLVPHLPAHSRPALSEQRTQSQQDAGSTCPPPFDQGEQGSYHITSAPAINAAADTHVP